MSVFKPPPASSPNPPTPAGVGSTAQIVVVNDEQVVCDYLCAIFERHGLRVRGFTGAAAALAAMVDEPPALIVTDLSLPGIDGWRLCRMLRSPAYRVLNQTPILVVSATYADANTVVLTAELGANDFVSLPVDPAVLVAKVDRLLLEATPPATPGVLIVSADEHEPESVGDVFAAHGHRVVRARSAEEGDALLGQGGWDVVVFDLDLSAGAEEWCGRWTGHHPSVAVVTVATDRDPEIAVRAMRAGASAHLRRPYVPDYLFNLCELTRREKSLLRVQRLLERSTRALRLSERELQAVVESTGQTFLLLDAEGRVGLFNDAATDLARQVFDRELQTGKLLGESLSPELAAMNARGIAGALAGRVVREEVPVRDRTGRARWLAVTLTPVRGPDGTINRVCFNAQDVTARREAENALRESEARFRTLADSAPVLIWVAEEDGGCSYFNESWLAFTGRTMAEEVGEGWAQGVHPDDRARCLEVFREAREARRAFTMEYRLRHHTGAYRWVTDTGVPRLSPEGGAPGYIGACVDIHARREAEGALLMRNHALASVSQGVMVADRNQRVTYVNPYFIRSTGWSEAEVLGRRCSFMQGPGTDEGVRNAIREALAKGESFRGEVLNYRKDGTPFWNELSIAPVRDAGGEIVQYIGVQTDVTARKEAERKSLQSARRLQALFDHSHDAILLADDEGLTVDANPAACQLLGYTQAEFAVLNVHVVFASEDREGVKAAWRDFLEVGRTAGELTVRRKSGGLVTVDYSAIAAIMPGLHLLMLRDITERRALQGQLLRQQRLESVGRLASGVAHDLNNILTPILMAPAMLRPQMADGNARMLLDTVENNARRGSVIVRQLLSFARGMPGEKCRLDLRKVVQDTLVIIRETFPKSVTIDWTPPAGEQAVQGDSTQLNQVLINLAINGSDAMPRGGRLAMSVEQTEVTAEEARLTPDAKPGRYVVLCVADHGHGIQPDHVDKIFDPFFTTKPFGQGSGLGLSTVLGIVRGHEGFIRVSSRPGSGTVVKVHLPVHVGATATAPAVVTVPQVLLPGDSRPVGNGRMVLVVDDESAVRDIVRMILARHGYKVMCADGADAALSQIRAVDGRVDLVLTDIAMPGVSGLRLTERLAVMSPGLPVLLMTGNDVDGAVPPRVMELVSGIVGKPFATDALLDAVAKAMAKGKAK